MSERKFYFTEHALDEIDNDNLSVGDIMIVAESGMVLEKYPKDKPFPSNLKLGYSTDHRSYPIHVVSAVDLDYRIHIITAYKPSPFKWDIAFNTRKK